MKLDIKTFLLISPLVVLSSLSASNGVTPPETTSFYFEPAYFGPFDGTEPKSTFSLTYSYNNNTRFRKVYELLEGRYNGMIVTRGYTDYHTLIKGGTYNVNLDFYSESLTINPYIDITFSIIDDVTHTYLYDKAFTVYKKTPSTINTSSLEEKIVKTKESVFSLSAGKAYGETFDFVNTDDVFGNDEYYRFDISNLSIDYSSIKPFTYTEAYLFYYDFKDLFPYLQTFLTGKVVTINLNITEENGRLYFSFKNSYYVNPKTLEVSLTKYQGWILSKYCYLPLKRRNDMEGESFTLRIEGAGFNESTIRHELTYYSSINLFGNCSDSEYCIKGGNI